MANPQVEDGYLRIAMELFVKLCGIRIPGEARQVLDAIFRFTYGYQKKWDRIAYSQFAALTGLQKPHVQRGIKTLRDMNLIIVQGEGGARTFSINKDWTTWRPRKKKAQGYPNKVTAEGVPQRGGMVTEKGNEEYPKKGTSIDRKISSKEIREDSLPDPGNADEFEACADLVFGWYNKQLAIYNAQARGITLTKLRLGKLRARFKEGFTLEQCQQAIYGCFHRSWNYHRGYVSFELIFRDADKMNGFVMAAAKPEVNDEGIRICDGETLGTFTDGTGGQTAI
jgi:phage replication O-like protein O